MGLIDSILDDDFILIIIHLDSLEFRLCGIERAAAIPALSSSLSSSVTTLTIVQNGEEYDHLEQRLRYVTRG